MNKRTEYIEKLSAQMVEWDVQIDLLKDKAKSLKFGAEPKYANKIMLLQQKKDEAAMKLQKMVSANDDEWEELKSGTEQVWGEIRGILSDAVTKIR